METRNVGKFQVLDSYGRVILYCDQEDFHRLQKILYSEAAIDNAITSTDDQVQSVIITLKPVVTEKPKPNLWLQIIVPLICSVVSGVPLIVGYVTIYRWIMDRLG